jgi:hypothetical protein
MTKNSKKIGMKLSQFSGIKTQPESEISKALPQETEVKPPPPPAEVKSPPPPTEVKPPPLAEAKQPARSEKPVSINIKISRQQHEWLNDTARVVRDNNVNPVPPGDRVYPQHLVSVAICSGLQI